VDVADVVAAGDDDRPRAHHAGAPESLLLAVVGVDGVEAHGVDAALELALCRRGDDHDRLLEAHQLLRGAEAELVEAADYEVAGQVRGREALARGCLLGGRSGGCHAAGSMIASSHGCGKPG